MNDWTKIGSYIKDYFKGITPKYVVNSDLAVLNQRCIRDNQINYSLMQHTDTSYSVNHNKIIKNGDILICSTGQGTAGRCALVYDLPTDCKITVDSHVLVLRCECIEIASSINNILFSQERLIMSFLSGSSGQAELDRIRVFDLKIKIPNSANELNKINQIFRQLQKKISLNNQINDNLEQLAKTLYDYWFVQFEFPNKDGKPYKSSGGKMIWNKKLKREIPEGWKVERIDSLISENKGGDWGKEELSGNYNQKVSCIRGADINSIKGDSTISELPQRYILYKNTTKILSENDIVIEISGGSPTQSTGRAAMITEQTIKRFENPLICSNFCQAITLKESGQVGYFFFMWCSFYNNNIFFNYEGKTSGIKNFLFDSFVANEWYVPSKEIAEKFQNIIIDIYQKKESLLRQSAHLTTFRDWLLPMLMNGQIKVSD